MATPSDEEDEDEPEQTVDDPAAMDSGASTLPELIELPPGTALTEEQAQLLALDRSVRIIVTAGAVDCGKTTLLTCVYDFFQTGPVGENSICRLRYYLLFRTAMPPVPRKF